MSSLPTTSSPTSSNTPSPALTPDVFSTPREVPSDMPLLPARRESAQSSSSEPNSGVQVVRLVPSWFPERKITVGSS
ncbi:hypothetical protein EHS25_007780 [Saitozyma podzolica]|uniref:Uncharacterized protein n=1 Tax=Saitozyma podzolica TaxID=1890683 RepID=A0A427YQN1_9TREE|nr:hypothetical protein EHS25_007780 [Saitozyma podzolica]